MQPENNTPKVSVILTSYNHKKYLPEAIDSILQQTFSDFELLVVDDASTDNSYEIIGSYEDVRIQFFSSKINTGYGGEIRKVISEIAAGDYIAIHHSDDVWEPDKLEKQVAFLDSNPQVGAVFTWAKIIDEKGNAFENKDHFYYKIFEQPNRTRYEWLNYFFYTGNALCHPSVLIRKEIYEEVGLYRYGMAQIADFDMWVRLALKYEIHVMPEKLVRFRVRQNEANSSGDRPETRIRSQFEYLQLLKNYRKISSYAELKKVFPKAEQYERNGEEDIGFVLGMIAVNAGTYAFTELFGLTLLFEALNDVVRVKKIKELYNFTQLDFIELTAQHDVFSVETIRNLYAQLAERDAQLAERDAQLAERDAQLAERDAQLAEREIELQEIKISRTWRLMMIVGKLRTVLFPFGSFRAEIARRIVAFFFFPLRIWRKIKLKKDERLLQASPFFEDEWYLSQNPDVATGDIAATTHYLLYGGWEGRDPSPYFSSRWYLDTYPDVRQSHINPLLHYLQQGQSEGRLPMDKEKVHFLQAKQEIRSNTFLAIFRYFINMFSYKINVFGGIRPALGNIWMQIRRKGLRKYIKEFQMKYRSSQKAVFLSEQSSKLDLERLKIEAFTVVPYYLNPYHTISSDTLFDKVKIAVHYHISNMENVQKCIPYLDNIPISFDLLISLDSEYDQNALSQTLRSSLTHLNEIIIKKVSPCKESLAPLIIEFSTELQSYDFFANLDVMEDSLYSSKDAIIDDALRSLFGSEGSVYQILELLLNDGKIIYSASEDKEHLVVSGWGSDVVPGERLLSKIFNEDLEEYPFIDFPRAPIFFAKTLILKEFSSISLSYSDFVVLDTTDSSQGQVLEKLLMVASNKVKGRNYRIYLSENIIRSPYYETQKDYSVWIQENAPKVLSYYLPQFYPTPENDKWHGKGFTEWHKVKSASPLFYGHDQQRAPHDDLGYYSLETSDTLKKQADMMKSAGVYGQIFYHYWFGGKKILEKPVQMLLEDKSIDMPFCFCWANENWTQKWDGNEDEILLAQDYSEKDARAFVEYLIPFFNDERYIKIDGKPVIFIYRPASIPDFGLYKRIWIEICKESNLPAPFVVAVLTRGAKSPYAFGMDAGTERILHDWTDGKVKDIKDSLYTYYPLSRSVLDYNEVADHYMAQSTDKEFPYFRSIVPAWDNTPRYGSDAYIVHNSTPRKFQEWLDLLVSDAKERLPLDKQFVIVNAWNEWAESDALEPDKKFGYAYLNSVGRSLSRIRFDDREYLNQKIFPDLNVVISMSSQLIDGLKNNEAEKEKLLTCIKNSTFFKQVNLRIGQQELFDWLPDSWSVQKTTENEKIDYILHIDDLCYFSSETVENMVKMAEFYGTAFITPSHINDESFTHASMKPRWGVDRLSSYLYLEKDNKKQKTIKCCVDASIFISSLGTSAKQKEKISTVVRFHGSSELDLLERALFSLMAQVDVRVQPIIMVQDLSDEKLHRLKGILEGMFWESECYPVIKQYKSTNEIPDLRSKMLNEGLKLATGRYATVLDYDDTIFYDSYIWLLDRLKKTEKNATFGLIYNVKFNLLKKEIVKRELAEFGETYSDFLTDNISPIHGFMLDLSKIDLGAIRYYDDMTYMEDYFLTLQIFNKDETDWDALKDEKYIGDYYFYQDKKQTLGNLETKERIHLLADPFYKICQMRIDELRKQKMTQ